MPAGFAFPNTDVELWTPLALDLKKYQRGTAFLSTVARTKEGVTPAQARQDLASVAARIRKADAMNAGPDFSFGIVSMRQELFGRLQKPLMILFCAVTFVLLIACVNVANLMIGRCAYRAREMAMRTALGASRTSLIRLLLTEGVLLSL